MTRRPLDDSEFLDVQGVAELLGIGEKAVYTLAYDVRQPEARLPYQEFPGIRIGQAWRFHRGVIAAVVAGTYRHDAPPPVVIPVRRRAS